MTRAAGQTPPALSTPAVSAETLSEIEAQLAVDPDRHGEGEVAGSSPPAVAGATVSNDSWGLLPGICLAVFVDFAVGDAISLGGLSKVAPRMNAGARAFVASLGAVVLGVALPLVFFAFT